MKWKGGTLRLTPAGVAVIISIVLFIGAILYSTFQPKQIEYIYKEVERFFNPPAIVEPPRPNL